MKNCVLHAGKTCNDCGECDDRCELDPSKVCDNCFRCLAVDKPFEQIKISGVYFDSDYAKGEDKAPIAFDYEDGFVMDLDDSWREHMHYHVKTLNNAFSARYKKRR